MVQTDVGLSDFTVDIGVAATPEGPWVGVFLDGPEYAQRRTVGDRESLPHGVLVGAMGWACVERVWLPDWVRLCTNVALRTVVRSVVSNGLRDLRWFGGRLPPAHSLFEMSMSGQLRQLRHLDLGQIQGLSRVHAINDSDAILVAMCAMPPCQM